MSKIKDKITDWGQVKLVCPCGGNPDLKYDFELKKKGGLIYYVCTNEECPNEFSSDMQLKVMKLLNKYYEKNHTFEGFSNYFRIKEDSIFQLYEEGAKYYDETQKDLQYSLTYSEFKEKEDLDKKKGDKYEGIKGDYSQLKVSALSKDLKEWGTDSSKTARFDEFKGKIDQDPYIYESSKIIEDIIAY